MGDCLSKIKSNLPGVQNTAKETILTPLVGASLHLLPTIPQSSSMSILHRSFEAMKIKIECYSNDIF